MGINLLCMLWHRSWTGFNNDIQDINMYYQQHSNLVSNSRTIDVNVQLSWNSHTADTSLLIILRVQRIVKSKKLIKKLLILDSVGWLLHWDGMLVQHWLSPPPRISVRLPFENSLPVSIYKIHHRGERHYESEMSCPRTRQSDPGDLNPSGANLSFKSLTC